MTQLEREETFIKAFREIDRDANGKLTPDEIIAVIDRTGEMTEEEARRLIACHDLDQDGSIDYAEFVAMLRSDASEGKEPSKVSSFGGARKMLREEDVPMS